MKEQKKKGNKSTTKQNGKTATINKTANPDSKYREYFLTINNPIDKDFTHKRIKELIDELGEKKYWCMCDEIGLENHTPHTHVYINLVNGASFRRIKGLFPTANIQVVKGQPSQVRDYVMKSGKWEAHEKADTKVEGTQEEWGTCPLKRQGARTDLNYLYEQITKDVSTSEIIEENPKYMLRMTEIDKVRQLLLFNRYKSVFRNLDVTYIWGDSGTGKTRGVMEKYGYENVYRITNYDAHPFDNYQGQDVIVLEEFRSSFRIQDMLNYLDGYPLQLPCRYSDKCACYTKVYIITNIPLKDQYDTIQSTQKATWEAFRRRIHHFEEYKKVSDTEVKVIKTDAQEYYDKADNIPPFK